MHQIPEQTRLQRDLKTPYPIAEPGYTYATLGTSTAKGRETCAVWTGEKRPPRKGEWYLSGASIAAYQAKGDMTTPYHIAKLARFEVIVTTHVIVETLPCTK